MPLEQELKDKKILIFAAGQTNPVIATNKPRNAEYLSGGDAGVAPFHKSFCHRGDS